MIIAYQLKRFDKITYENHVKRAADFLVKTGPKTPQERWEEKSGYSPSTIAAEIARRNGDEASATVYLATPLAWSMAQFIRLAANLQAGRNLDTPDVVYNRYVLGRKTAAK